MAKKVTSVALDTDLLDELRSLSKAQGESMGVFIRTALRSHIRKVRQAA